MDSNFYPEQVLQDRIQRIKMSIPKRIGNKRKSGGASSISLKGEEGAHENFIEPLTKTRMNSHTRFKILFRAGRFFSSNKNILNTPI